MHDKLIQLEKKYSIDWREYEIGELFTKRTMKGFPKKAENLEENNKGFHIFGQNIKYQYPQRVLIDEKYLHNVDENKPILAYTSSTGELGIITESFYRSGDNGAFQGLFFKYSDYNKNHILYLWGALSRIFNEFGYSTGMADILKVKIQLPTKNNELALKYIEEFVSTLKAERLAMLNEYLLATGLKDITLSKGECSALDRLEDNSVNWREFSLPKLFMIKNTHCILSRDIVKNSGIIPYLTASQSNNAVGTYIEFDKRQIEEGNSIFVGGKTFVVTYQKENYFSNDSHNLALYYKDTSKRTKENQLFMTTAIYKSLSHLYSWGNSISHSKIQKDSVMLPCDDEGKIDFDFMSTLVSAVQKVVIKNVVTYIDKQIDMTGKIIKGL